jgi:TolB-like protein/tetratricopeptide (TPR) repeat protein
MTAARRVRFGPFELDLESGDLARDGNPVRLEPQPLKVLLLLASRAGRVVSRQEIQTQVWRDDTFVDFNQGLNYCIRQIRLTLGDSAGSPRFIETLPRRGYRLVARLETRGAGRVLLAVLPFENLSGEVEQEFFSDGLTEEMISQLGRLNPEQLGVIARTSAMRYKHAGKTIDVIARELGVSYVLEGSVRQAGNRIRVTAQLVQVTDQTPVWTHTFERSLGDILALQSDVAHAIATQIGITLSPHAAGRLAEPRTVQSAAYEAYLKGRYYWKRRSRNALQTSVQYFKQAIEIDSGYAPAYAGLADVCLTQMDHNYLPPREAFGLADEALGNALRLDDTLAEPHTSLGHLRLHQLDWLNAERAFARSIALNGGYDAAHFYLSNLLAALGRFDEAVAAATRAIEFDPMTANARGNRVFILYLARRYDEAIREGTETLDMDPTYTPLHYHLGLSYAQQGAYDRALDAFTRIRRSSPNPAATVLAAIGYTQARAGQRPAALEALHSLEAMSASEYVSPYGAALLHLALGDKDRACALLTSACEEYSSFTPFLGVDPRLDELRTDERFLALVARLHLPAHRRSQ